MNIDDIVIRVAADTAAARRGLRELDQSVGALSKGMLQLAAAAAGVIGMGAMTEGFVDANVEAGRLRASLETVTGSVRGASDAWDSLSEFAKRTPFDLAQSVEGFIALKARGLDPSIAAMESYANTASAMSKTLNDMIQLVADVAMGQFERLAEFGMAAEKSGDQIAFTFNKVTTVVKDNAQDIERYLQSIGNTEFAGAVTRQTDTLGVAISNVKDAIMKAWVAIGDSGLVSAVVDGLKWIAEWIETISKNMAAGDFDAWIDGLKGVAGAAAGASGFYLAMSAAVEAATVAQTAFNLIASANPYVLAALAVGALVGALYALRDVEFEVAGVTYTIRDAAVGAWGAISDAASVTADLVGEAWLGAVSQTTLLFDALGVDIGAVVTGVAQTFAMLFDGLKKDAVGVVNGLTNLFVGFGKSIGTLAGFLVAAFSHAFDDIAKIGKAAFQDLANFDLTFAGTRNAIMDGARAQMDNFAQMGDEITDNFTQGVDFVGSVAGTTEGMLDRLGDRIKDVSLNRQLDEASEQEKTATESRKSTTLATRDLTAATSGQTATTEKLTKAQRENNAEMDAYVERIGNVLHLSDKQKAAFKDYLPWIDEMSKKYGVAKETIIAMIDTESSWNKHARSPAGALGLMQVMPDAATDVARAFGIMGDSWKTDPFRNIETGVAYLSLKVKETKGNMDGAIRSYNQGYGAFKKGLFPAETVGYLEQVNRKQKDIANASGAAGQSFLDDLAKPANEAAKMAAESADQIARAAASARGEVFSIVEDSLDDLTKEEIRYQRDLATLRDAQIEGTELAAAARLAIEKTHAEAMLQIQKDNAGPMEKYLDGLREGIGNLETVSVDMMDGFRDAVIDGLADGRLEFDDFADDIKRKLIAMAVDTIILNFAGNILGIAGGTGAGGAAAGAAQAAAGTVNLSAGSLASLGNMFTGSSIGVGAAALMDKAYLGLGGSANGLAANTGWNGLTGNLAATPNWALGAGSIGGALLGSALFDGGASDLGAQIGGAAGSAMGAMMIGQTLIPIPGVGAIIGGVLGGIAGGGLGSLFGDKTPRQGHYSTSYTGAGLEDNVSSAGAFGLKFGLADKGTSNVKASEYQKAFDGMATVSNAVAAFYGPELSAKIQTSMQATIPSLNQWGKDLNGAFDAIFSGILWHADVVEGAAGDGLGHLLALAVGDLGGTAEQMAAQIDAGMRIVNASVALYNSEIGKLMGMGDGLEFGSLEATMNALKAAIFSFARGGETSTQTIERMAGGMGALAQAMGMAGQSLDTARMSAFDFMWMAQRFPDALAYFGFSLDSLMQTQSAYYEHFWTAEEKATKQRDASLASITAWSESIGKTGEATIDTSAEFRTYVESLDLLTVAGQDQYLSAMQQVGAFVALDGAMTTLNGSTAEAGVALASVADFIAGLKPDSLTQTESVDAMTALFGDWGQTLPETAGALYALIQAGSLTDEQLQTLANRSDTLTSAFAGLDAVAKANADALADSAAATAKTRALDIGLMQAQGDVQGALTASRQDELAMLSDTDAAIQRQINAADDLAKTHNLEIGLMSAQGFAYQALELRRQAEIDGMSEMDANIQRQINAADDLAKTHNLEIELMQAQGLAYQALQANRELEISGMSEMDANVQRQINAAEDLAKTHNLEITLLDAQGNTQAALTARRQANTRNLSLELMGMLGDEGADAALSRTRDLEIAGMSETDATIKRLIYAQEDYNAAMDAGQKSFDAAMDAYNTSMDDYETAMDEYTQTMDDFNASLDAAKGYQIAWLDARWRAWSTQPKTLQKRANARSPCSKPPAKAGPPNCSSAKHARNPGMLSPRRSHCPLRQTLLSRQSPILKCRSWKTSSRLPTQPTR